MWIDRLRIQQSHRFYRWMLNAIEIKVKAILFSYSINKHTVKIYIASAQMSISVAFGSKI